MEPVGTALDTAADAGDAEVCEAEELVTAGSPAVDWADDAEPGMRLKLILYLKPF